MDGEPLAQLEERVDVALGWVRDQEHANAHVVGSSHGAVRSVSASVSGSARLSVSSVRAYLKTETQDPRGLRGDSS